MKVQDRSLSRQLGTLFNVGVIRDLGDGQLLERFATGQGEAAELAFAAILERHGAMVLRVCQAQLPDMNDAHDAFQATFLLLIERSSRLWVRDTLGPWLHQVALRTARCARSSAARRKRLEQAMAVGSHTIVGDPSDLYREESERRLHLEIDRLPERYRVPIVLCDLEGKTVEEVARRLGRPVGTVKCWRARGREKLKHRLIRAGITPAIGLGFATRSRGNWESALISGSQSVAESFLKILSTNVIPGSIQFLVKGVSRNMMWNKLATTALAGMSALLFGMIAVAGLAAGVGEHAADPVTQPDSLAVPRPLPPDESRAGQSWRLGLPEAIRIGLQNHADRIRFLPAAAANPKKTESKSIATTSHAADVKDVSYLVITNAHNVTNPRQFRAEVMALVRSIANTYWNLSLQQSRLMAAEEALELVGKLAVREKAELAAGQSTTADVAESQQRLEQCRLDVVTRTSDIITAERQLRTILGLPVAENSRIVPVSDPIKDRIEYDWNECLASMRENLLSPGATSDERLSDVATHGLARVFLEIDANYKQFATAAHLRKAAVMRLESQRSYYEEGRITIDRFMDAIAQFAQANVQEAQGKVAYNVSIVMLEEARGTLLHHFNIDVVDLQSSARKAERPGSLASATLPQPPPIPPVRVPPLPSPVPESETETLPAAAPSPVASPSSNAKSSESDRKAITFQLTIPFGPRPIEIRGSLTIAPIAAEAPHK